MKKSSKLAALALSVALALGIAVPAFAADTYTDLKNDLKIDKQMEANSGSTFDVTFGYTITPIQLTTTGAATVAETPKPTSPVTIQATRAAESIKSDDLGLANLTYPHAGVYAYQIKETAGKSHLRADQRDEMTYDPTVYTVFVYVINGKNGPEVSAITAVNKEVTAVPAYNTDKVAAIKFDNKYWEDGNEKNPNTADLVVDKVVDGAQGDQSKKWTFTVTFDDSDVTVKPNGWTKASIQYQIVTTGENPVESAWKPVPADGKYTIKHNQQILFNNIVTGTTYKIDEAEKNQGGYTTTGLVDPAKTVTDEGNKETVTNKFKEITVTGVILNNAPFILMGSVAIAGVVLYGIAKRKLLA